MMFMAHMQRAGHRPIALLGGGTAMVGDPSGKTDMRSMLTKEQIEHNVSCIKKQMEKFIDFSDDKAILVNNRTAFLPFLRRKGSSCMTDAPISLDRIWGRFYFVFKKFKTNISGILPKESFYDGNHERKENLVHHNGHLLSEGKTAYRTHLLHREHGRACTL